MELFCDNCERHFDPKESPTHYDVWVYQEPYDSDTPFLYYLCSPHCLTEWGWKCRESLPKLSKSKEPNDLA